MLTDTIIRAGRPSEVTLLRPACESMGQRTGRLAPDACRADPESFTLTPVYECELFGACAPWAVNREQWLIRPCAGCLDYFPKTIG